MDGFFARVNWVDIVALILLIRVSYVSSRIGVGRQILPFVFLGLILTVSLYNYQVVASFFIDRYGFLSSLCRFLSYLFMTLVFSLIYHVASHIVGFRLFTGEIQPSGTIEKVGGTLLGVVRSIFIVGIISTGLLLTPVKFIEASAKSSSIAVFCVRTNFKVYTFAVNLFLKGSKKSYSEGISELFSKKERYLFRAEQ